MRKIGAALVASSLLVSSAFAADTAPASGPLAPGKPAGTNEAALQTGGVMLFVGLAAAAGLIALIASTTQGSSSTGTSS